MSYQIQQSTTTWELLFFMVQSSDHITALTGASPTVTIRKSGGSFASPVGTVSEIANGWYKVAGNATDTGTLGPLLLHATATSGDPSDTSFEIVAFNPQDSVRLGLTGIPNATPGAAGGVFIAGTNAATTVTTSLTTTFTGNLTGSVASVTGATGSVTGAVGSVTGNVGGNVTGSVGSVVGLTASNLDTTVSSRMATYTQPTGFLAATFPGGTMANTTNITAGTITTTINLTNAPTTGDFTATMKTSLNAATPASITGAVGSVTGNVGGSVGSVATAVTVDGLSPLTEAYASKGSAFTLASALYGMNQQIGQRSEAGTTITVQKRDGVTAAMTFTIDSATDTSSIAQVT